MLLALLFAFGGAKKKVLPFSQVRELARSVGFPDPELAAAVAMAESGGNALATGDLMLGVSVGLWQINLRAHPEYSSSSLLDPTTNARAALAISKGGTDWNPWTTFRTGAYKRFLPKGAAA